MTEPPISYPDALAAVKLVNFHLARSAPHVFDMTGPKFAEMVFEMRKVEELHAAIVKHRAKSASRETGGRI